MIDHIVHPLPETGQLLNRTKRRCLGQNREQTTVIAMNDHSSLYPCALHAHAHLDCCGTIAFGSIEGRPPRLLTAICRLWNKLPSLTFNGAASFAVRCTLCPICNALVKAAPRNCLTIRMPVCVLAPPTAKRLFENATVVVVRRVFLRFRCSRPFCFGDQFYDFPLGFGGSLRFSARSHIDLKAAPLRFSKAAPAGACGAPNLERTDSSQRILKQSLSCRPPAKSFADWTLASRERSAAGRASQTESDRWRRHNPHCFSASC